MSNFIMTYPISRISFAPNVIERKISVTLFTGSMTFCDSYFITNFLCSRLKLISLSFAFFQFHRLFFCIGYLHCTTELEWAFKKISFFLNNSYQIMNKIFWYFSRFNQNSCFLITLSKEANFIKLPVQPNFFIMRRFKMLLFHVDSYIIKLLHLILRHLTVTRGSCSINSLTLAFKINYIFSSPHFTVRCFLFLLNSP